MSEPMRLTVLAGPMSRLLILGAIVLLGAALPAHAADADHGAKVFATQCGECHSVKPGKNRTGPSLFGVIGRGAGSVADYRYSDAMKHSGLTWTADELDLYLTDPRKVVPGGKMKYRGLTDSGARADLIAYLNNTR